MDMDARIFEIIDDIRHSIKELCERMTRQEAAWEMHLRNIEAQAASKEKRFYITIALIGSAVAIYEVLSAHF